MTAKDQNAFRTQVLSWLSENSCKMRKLTDRANLSSSVGNSLKKGNRLRSSTVKALTTAMQQIEDEQEPSNNFMVPENIHNWLFHHTATKFNQIIFKARISKGSIPKRLNLDFYYSFEGMEGADIELEHYFHKDAKLSKLEYQNCSFHHEWEAIELITERCNRLRYSLKRKATGEPSFYASVANALIEETFDTLWVPLYSDLITKSLCITMELPSAFKTVKLRAARDTIRRSKAFSDNSSEIRTISPETADDMKVYNINLIRPMPGFLYGFDWRELSSHEN